MSSKQINGEYRMIKSHPNFVKELEEIKIERIKKRIDSFKGKSIKRITLAIIRHKNWNEIKKDIINHKLPEENEK